MTSIVLIALMKPYPAGFEGFGGATTPTTYAEAIAALQPGFSLPWSSEAEMLAGYDEILAAKASRSAAKATRDTARAAIAAQWAALPPWIRGPFGSRYAEAVRLLDDGDDAAAICIIEYSDVPWAYTGEQAAAFEMIRKELMAALQSLSLDTPPPA